MAATSTVTGRQRLYEVAWISGCQAGIRHVWAPDAQTAAATLAENPSVFGIAHEQVIVGRARRLSVRITTDAAIRD